MQLEIGPYLADTVGLTPEEDSAYLRLLMHYWLGGKPPDDNPEVLALITRLSPERWLAVSPKLEQYFAIRSGKWVHERVEKDLCRMQKRRVAGRKGGRPSVNTTARKQTENGLSKNADLALSKNAVLAKGRGRGRGSLPSDDLSSKDHLHAFEEFWLRYPRRLQPSGGMTRGNRRRAEAEWDKLTPDDQNQAIEGIEPYKRVNPDRTRAVCDAQRYLRDRRWEDATDAESAPAGRDGRTRHPVLVGLPPRGTIQKNAC